MDESSYEFKLAKLLTRLNKRLATAESCTGGLIGHRITNIPGSSAYYLGGLIAYANQVKTNQLGVNVETLDQHGAVSGETVLEMARGARITLDADIGLSVSGIAGPGGGTPEKPVGLTWIGLSAGDYEQAWCFTWSGDRLQIKENAAEKALELLFAYLSADTNQANPKAQSQSTWNVAVHRDRKENNEMEPIEVTVHFQPDGEISILTIRKDSLEYPLLSTGRNWKDEGGLHVLVMLADNQVWEVFFNLAEFRWYLSPSPTKTSKA